MSFKKTFQRKSILYTYNNKNDIEDLFLNIQGINSITKKMSKKQENIEDIL